jgi:purine-cytosine permease-like protein
MDRKLGIESQSTERVPPDARKPPNQLVMGFMWASATMNLSSLVVGFLGNDIGLSLTQSILITIFATLLGSAVTVSSLYSNPLWSGVQTVAGLDANKLPVVKGWCATLGPGTGLRQVAISRYSLGFYPSSIIAALNVVAQIGWASISCITGGLALSAVSDGSLSSAVGVIIVASISLGFSFVGLKGVLVYERYAWILSFVVFMVMYGEAGPQANLNALPTVSGSTQTGVILTFFAIIYGTTASWSSIVSDLYVHYPVNTSKVKIFCYTTIGITIPTCIGMLLGCCISSALSNNREWSDAYSNGIGELVKVTIYPRGFAKFILVLLVLSGSKLLFVHKLQDGFPSPPMPSYQPVCPL